MDYEFEMEKPFIVTTADMLEIAASGGNGSEYVDIVGLMENAAKELREKDAEIERLRKQAHYHYENGLKKDVEIDWLREEVTWYSPDPLRWEAPYVKDDPRVSAIIKAALKEGE